MTAANVITPQQWHEHKQKKSADAKKREHPGRPYGKPHGTWVTDIAAGKQGVVLCSKCVHKFDPNQYNYYRTREFSILGRCDGCREFAQVGDATFFIHESLLGRKHGQCWTPR